MQPRPAEPGRNLAMVTAMLSKRDAATSQYNNLEPVTLGKPVSRKFAGMVGYHPCAKIAGKPIGVTKRAGCCAMDVYKVNGVLCIMRRGQSPYFSQLIAIAETDVHLF